MAIARPVLPKAVHFCSDHFTKEVKRRLLDCTLKFKLKPGGAHRYFHMEMSLINQDNVLFSCSKLSGNKTSMIESIFNKVASCRIQHK